MDEQPINRLSGFAPILMSVLALLAVAHSLRHAEHEDGAWHIWVLSLLLQVPVIVYFVVTSRRSLLQPRRLLLVQAAFWILALAAGACQRHWN